MPDSPANRHRQAAPLTRLAIFISVLGSLGLLVPLSENPEWQPLLNFLHIPLFCLVAWTWTATLRATGRSRLFSVAMVFAIGIAVAVVSELIQIWVPGRYADYDDLARDAVGLLLGVMAGALWPRLSNAA
ncbi:MAG: VanZ family protein [Rhodanobacteraceae bacterium]|nr:VanZ family protein [Rhodanobacteraceae bacterium]